MSLLEEAYEDFTIIDKVTVPDGYGSITVEWRDGAKISGAMVKDRSIEAKTAQAMGVTALYTLTVHKDVTLDYHTVLRRESDGLIFRLTTNTDDAKTPASAGLNMRQYDAEEFILPRE